MMRRRSPIGGISACAACAAGLYVRAQTPGRTYRIGYPGNAATNTVEDDRIVAAFVHRLRELGFGDGGNLTIEWRYAEGKLERYAEFGAEMVHLGADLVVAGNGSAARALMTASRSMPVVTVGVPDPVRAGFVASLAHPGGQVTGISNRPGCCGSLSWGETAVFRSQRDGRFQCGQRCHAPRATRCAPVAVHELDHRKSRLKLHSVHRHRSPPVAVNPSSSPGSSPGEPAEVRR